MPNIDRINVNGTSYDVMDATARVKASAAMTNADAAVALAQNAVSYAAPQTISDEGKATARSNIGAASEAVVSNIGNTVDDIFDVVSGDDAPVWEIGGINASNGANSTTSIRIRTVSAIAITPYINITVPDGAWVSLRPYKANGTFVAYGTAKFTGTFNLANTIGTWLANHTDVTQMRFIASFSDDRTITDVTDLPITVTNPVLVDSVELKNRLDNIVDATLSESGKAADAATVGSGLYRTKNRTSNTAAALTFWRPTQDGFDTTNKFTPADMPINTYAYALGNAFSGFIPDSDVVSANSYWLVKLQSTYNANIRLYFAFCYGDRSMWFGQTITAGGTLAMIRISRDVHTPSIMFFGDSITRGINSDASTPGNQSNSVWSEVNLPNLLTAELGITVDNYGIGSIGWMEPGSATKGKAIEYLQRVGNAEWYWDGSGTYVNNKFIGSVKTWSDYNTVILAFGANDRAVGGTGTVLGSIEYIDDTMSYADVMAMVPTTIVEAMYQCYRYIREQAPTINIILSDPLIQKGGTAPEWSYPTRYSSSRWSWYELCDMYAAFAKRYGLGHISNYDAPINRVDVNVSLKDNVHPTTDCYRQLGRHFAGKISELVF